MLFYYNCKEKIFMITTKIIPLNQNSNKVLELLNENKHNLCHLVMQYDNIIELYLQLLGGKDWGKPNSNEIILPEIINLLETLNYNCDLQNQVFIKMVKLFSPYQEIKFLLSMEKTLLV